MQEIAKHFRRGPEGEWTCIAPVTLSHPSGRIQFTEGAVFRRGERFMGVEIARWLDELTTPRE